MTRVVTEEGISEDGNGENGRKMRGGWRWGWVGGIIFWSVCHLFDGKG